MMGDADTWQVGKCDWKGKSDDGHTLVIYPTTCDILQGSADLSN